MDRVRTTTGARRPAQAQTVIEFPQKRSQLSPYLFDLPHVINRPSLCQGVVGPPFPLSLLRDVVLSIVRPYCDRLSLSYIFLCHRKMASHGLFRLIRIPCPNGIQNSLMSRNGSVNIDGHGFVAGFTQQFRDRL